MHRLYIAFYDTEADALDWARDCMTTAICNDQAESIGVDEFMAMCTFEDKLDALDPEIARAPHWLADEILNVAEKFVTKPYLPFSFFNRQHIFSHVG